jgi:hypothetical protein
MKHLLLGLATAVLLFSSVSSAQSPYTDKAGMAIVTTHCDTLSPATKVSHYDYSDLRVAKLHMQGEFCSDATVAQQLINVGVTTLILRTDDTRIDWGRVKYEVERIHGSGDSYDAVIRRNPGVTFWLEIGNEPDHAGYAYSGGNQWVYRWTALDTYKTLATNSYGKIPQAWRQKYPNMKWAVSLPTIYSQAMDVLSWNSSDGGVRDYYDAIATHLYGSFNVYEPGSGDWTRIYDFLLNDVYTKAILLTEAGIHDPNTSDTTKAQRYYDFTRNSVYPKAKVKAITFWHFDAVNDNSSPGYSYNMESRGDLHIVRYRSP